MSKNRKYIIIVFCMVFLVYNLITMPLLVFYGPFKELKATVVGTIATSRHPQFLKLFYSEAKVRQLMRDSGLVLPDDETQGNDEINFNAKVDERIELENIETGKFKGKLLKIHNPKSIKIVPTKDLLVAGEKTSDIAKRVGAVAAINGGGFDDPNGKGNGGFPQGITIHEGKVLTGKGIKYAQSIIGLDQNGLLVVGNYTLLQLQSMKVREAVTFGPQLIKGGKRKVRGNGGWGIGPRTVIGQTKEGTILMLVIDGRQISSLGASLKDVQEIMLDHGAVNAANLDGGSSTTMFYDGSVINSPANPFGERYVPTAFVVMPTKQKGGNQ